MRVSTSTFDAFGLARSKSSREGSTFLKRDRYIRLSQPPSLRGFEGVGGTLQAEKGKQKAVDVPYAPRAGSLASGHPAIASNVDINGSSTSRFNLDANANHPLHATGSSPLLVARANDPNLRDHPFDLSRNLPLLLLVIVGSVVAFATLATSLAFLCRSCCGWQRKDRKRRTNGAWGPSATDDSSTAKASSKDGSEWLGKEKGNGTLGVSSTSLPVLLFEEGSGASEQPPSYATDKQSTDAGEKQLEQGAKLSADGRGWNLFDGPFLEEDSHRLDSRVVEARRTLLPEQPVPAISSGPCFGSAKATIGDHVADLEGGRGAVPVRRPSFIERVIKQRGSAAFHNAEEVAHAGTERVPRPEPVYGIGLPGRSKGAYPNVRSLPGHGTETPQLLHGSVLIGTGASRFAGKSVNASRSVLSKIPATLRNAASTSRSRVLDNRYLRPNAINDSDFEGTIGGRDRDLPKAKRIGKKAERFTMEYSTEEEPSPAGFDMLAPQTGFGDMGTPSGRNHLLRTPGHRLDFTPGLAGIGAAWPNHRSGATMALASQIQGNGVIVEQPLQNGMGNVAPVTLPAIGENIAIFPHLQRPMPAMDYQRAALEQRLQWEAYMMGHSMSVPHHMLAMAHQENDNRQRLMATVSKWQEDTRNAEPVDDAYTSVPPSVRESLHQARSHARRLERHNSSQSAASGLAFSEITSISSGSSVTGLSAFYEGRGATSRPLKDDELSRAPSIRPQFAATTTLSSWLEPTQVSTTHGLKSHEEECWEDIEGDEGRDPFASDVGLPQCQLSASSPRGFEVGPTVQVKAEPPRRNRPKPSRKATDDSVRSSRSKVSASPDKARPKRTVKSGYGSSTGRVSPRVTLSHDRARPRSLSRLRSSSSSTHTSRTRTSVRSSAALSTGASTNLSSLFDAEPKLLPSRLGKGKGSRLRQSSKAEAKADLPEIRLRRQSVKEMLPEDVTASVPTEDSSAASHDGFECVALAGQSLTRQTSVMTTGSIYSELTAPDEYGFRAPLLALDADSASKKLEPGKKASKASLLSASSVESSIAKSSRSKMNQAEKASRPAHKERPTNPAGHAKGHSPTSFAGPVLRQPKRESARSTLPSDRLTSSFEGRSRGPVVLPHATGMEPICSRKEAKQPRHPSRSSQDDQTSRRASRAARAISGSDANRVSGGGLAATRSAPSSGAAPLEKRVRSHGSKPAVRPRNTADYDEEAEGDSPWTSSDSDISLRRWGASALPVAAVEGQGSRRRR